MGQNISLLNQEGITKKRRAEGSQAVQVTVQTAKLFAKEFASLGVYNKNPTPQKKKEVLLYHQQYLQVFIPHLLGYYELPRYIAT
jgi:hypothetical protein